jgi:hypothetical protein
MARPAMMPATAVAVCAAVLALAATALGGGVRAQQLSTGYYDDSCPHVYDTVRRVIQEARTGDHRILASLLRLHFHDCFASVRARFTQRKPRRLPLPLPLRVTQSGGSNVSARLLIVCAGL